VFSARDFGGGRARVYGCSPGCLVASLLLSLVLTLAINLSLARSRRVRETGGAVGAASSFETVRIRCPNVAAEVGSRGRVARAGR